MRKQYRSIQNVLRLTMPILALLVFSLLMYFTPTTSIFLRAVRIVSGVISLIFIPGFYIAETFFDDNRGMTIFGFSLIFGLAFQTLIILSLYSIGSLFLYNVIDFSLTLVVLTFFFTSLLFVLTTRVKQGFTNVIDRRSLGDEVKAFVVNNRFLIAVFVFSLAVRLYYQGFFGAPVTDGSLYLEMARNLETTGQFTSEVIKDSWATHFFNELGFSQHPFTYFIIAIFFSMGGVHFSSAKLMTVFVGVLVVFIIYEISKELFGEEIAMMATLIAAIHPLLLLYSSVIYGSEIQGTLFVLTTFYFFLKSLRSNLSSSRRYAIFAGLFAALTLGTTKYNYWAFWFTTLFLFLLVLTKEKIRTRAKIVKFLTAFFLVVGVIVTTYLTSDMYFIHTLSSSFWVIYSSIPVVFVVIMFWKRNDKHVSSIYWMGMVTFAIYQFVMVRTYYLGQIIPRESVVQITSPVPGVSLPLAIVGIAVLQLRNLVAFSGFYNIFWEMVVKTSTLIIGFLAFLSFIRVAKWKEHLYIFSFPLSLSILMTLFGVPTRITYWDYRLYLATTPFFIILSASTLWLLPKAIRHVEIPTSKGVFRIKRFVFVTSLVIVILFASFFSLYGEWITPMKGKYERTLYWKPAFDWIRMNTPEDAVLMTIKPREFAWDTNRATVAPLGPPQRGVYAISTKTLIDSILQFKVDYVVVDEVFYAEYWRLRYLYEYPSDVRYGFDLVFNHVDSRGKLLIYDVTSISSPIDSRDLYPSDDAYTYRGSPDANTGNLTWLYVGKGAAADTDLHPLFTYLKFDLSRIPGEKEILNAKLKLYTKNIILGGVGGVDSTNLKVLVNYVADDNWNEQNLTYNNQPAFYTEIFNASQSKETYGIRDLVTWDITELVEKEYNEDGVLSIVLEMDYVSLKNTRVEFFSEESLYEPVLEVDFTI